MKKHLKMSQSLPASGQSPAGNAHVPMTDEEKMRQRNRLLRTPAPVKERASRFVACWITDQLAAYGFDPFNGPFSEKEMNGDAVWIICTESYRAIYDGEWRWPENRKLSTQMIQIAKSKMSHIVRDFKRRDKAKDDLPTSQMTHTQLMQMEEAAGQWEMESQMMDLAYEIAESAAAWVHCREKDNVVSVSSQYLVVDPAVYTNYQGQEAFNASINSYGGTSKGSAQRSSKPNQPRNVTGNTGH